MYLHICIYAIKRGRKMSDRWDFIEKEMDEEFVQRLKLNENFRNAQLERDKFFMKKYHPHMSDEEINNIQFYDKYVDDVYLGYRLKFHKVKKKLRKLIYYIFKW